MNRRHGSISVCVRRSRSNHRRRNILHVIRMKTVFLIACAGTKCDVAVQARNLYVSPLFQKSRAYVLRQLQEHDLWFILSARHGLLKPGTVVAPYNQTLNTMVKSERHEWARKVGRELKGVLEPGDQLVFLAGLRYRELLEPEIAAGGCSPPQCPCKGWE